MNKLIINFPGGAGGNWLSNLIYLLENNICPPEHNTVHFHYNLSSKSVEFTHFLDHNNVIFLNGKYLFNIYLNVVQKFRIHDQSVQLKTISEQIKIFELEAGEKINYKNKRIDLNFDYLFLNPRQFITDLFNILDSHNILYSKNIDYCLRAIDNFKKTCISPQQYYNNFDSIIWIGWCAGITQTELTYHPTISSIEEAKELLMPDKDFFEQYTRELTLSI